MQWRTPPIPELALISQLGFEPYFLTVADIVRWARDEQGTLCQGRGSAANSAVCYCLASPGDLARTAPPTASLPPGVAVSTHQRNTLP